MLELSKQTHLCAAAIMENFHLTYTLWKSGCVPRTQGRLRGAFRPPTPGAACGRAAASTAGVFSADLEREGSRGPGVGGAEDAEGYDEALCVKGPRTSSGELAERARLRNRVSRSPPARSAIAPFASDGAGRVPAPGVRACPTPEPRPGVTRGGGSGHPTSPGDHCFFLFFSRRRSRLRVHTGAGLGDRGPGTHPTVLAASSR